MPIPYEKRLKRGADIVIKKWVRLKPWERLLIVSTNKYMDEIGLLEKSAASRSRHYRTMIVEEKGKDIGIFFDENARVFDNYDAIIAACEYSLVTTQAAKRAIELGKKFLSFPLSTNIDESLLSFDFLTMDTRLSKMMAKVLMKHLENAANLYVKSAAGTNLSFSMQGRVPGFFNGVCKDGKGFSSASIEIYIPIIESSAQGLMVVDGSLGYLGCPSEPIRLSFQDGRICSIEANPAGDKLLKYVESFQDERMYIASEFGIGLNSISACRGKSYIEDESTYGTFHVGFGRNLALGGIQEAKGHYDLVMLKPYIWADNRAIMEDGVLVIPDTIYY